MDVTLHIPDELAQRLKAASGDLSRRAKALALEEYKLGHLTGGEMRRLLGFGAQEDVNAFLTAHGVRGAGTGQEEADQTEHTRAALEAARAIRQMSRGVRLGGLKIKDLINEGHF